MVGAIMLAVAFLSPGVALSQSDGERVCAPLKQAPEIDGVISDDPAWAGNPETSGFKVLGGGAAGKQTRFRVGYTADALYAAIVCDETERDKITAEQDDGGKLWEEDGVELFLSPDGKSELQFAVNTLGSRASSATLKRWKAAANVEDERYSIEIEIPWEIIGVVPKPGEAWGLNVCRNNLTSGNMEHNSWASVEKSFHEPANFGRMVFQGLDAATAASIAKRIKDNPVSEDVFLVSREALGIQRVTERATERILWAQGAHVAPQLSPDKKTIVYTSMVGGKPGVWIAGIDGKDPRRLCDGCQATWLPDGKRVVLQRNGRIVEFETVTGKERFLSRPSKLIFEWPSPTQDEAIICVETKTGSIVRLYRKEGREGDVLVKGGCQDRPRCSPDGSLLAYRRGAHVCVMDVQTGIARRTTLAPGVQSGPVWAVGGHGICYAQTSDLYSDTWDINFVSLKDLGTVNVIERAVHGNFDWRGASPAPAETKTVKGATLTLWNRKEDAEIAALSDIVTEKGWKQIPPGMPGCDLVGSAAVETDWLVFSVSASGVQVIPKAGAATPFRIPLRVTDIAGSTFPEVQEIRLLRIETDAVALAVGFGAGKGETLQVVFHVLKTSPVVEISTESPKSVVSVLSAMSRVVVPDRFANDIVLDPAAVGERSVLPTAPLCLGFLDEPRGIIGIITPSPDQFVGVVKPGGGTAFEEIAVAPRGGSFYLSLVMGDKLWSNPEIAKPGARDGWGVKWRNAFRGQWRMTAWNGEIASSRMWNGVELDERMVRGFSDVDVAEGQVPSQVLQGIVSSSPALPVEWEAKSEPQGALAYIWAREANTPYDVLAVEDTLIDALGQHEYAKLFDIEGLRSFRLGEGWLPFKDLDTRELDWAPWESHLETRGFGVLDIMSGVFPAGTPGTKAFITHMGNDAIKLIEGLDSRIMEYDRAIDAMRAYCAVNDDNEFLKSLAAEARLTLETGRDAERDDLAKARNALDALLALSEPKGKRLWNDDIIYRTDEFRDFSRSCRALLEQRQKVLAGYRSFAKRVRDDSARRMLTDPAFRNSGDRLRETARLALRNRYYLEQGWGGEVPVDAPTDK